MPVLETQGAASAKGYGFGASSAANYIEDVFSTYLYTGTGASQTITNGIDLAGKGGLVWLKSRSAATNNALYDTARVLGGLNQELTSNTSGAQSWSAGGLDQFLANGFSIGNLARINTSAATYASWTFREQPKFFDIVTYTGTGANRTIAHNLGSVPGCIIVKRTDATNSWQVYHRSLANTQYLILNGTDAAATGATRWNSTTPTSTVFSLGTDASVNVNGGTYVAYIFAHNAGGFGATGTDNVISCGSFTTDGSGNQTLTLGWEPQFLIVKRTDSTDSWKMLDNMRGWPNGGNDSLLFPNLANAESAPADYGHPFATGLIGTFDASAPYIYIAIRRGPMKTPTTGTSVFSIGSVPNGSSAQRFTGNFFDLDFHRALSSTTDDWRWADRLRGIAPVGGTGVYLASNTTAAEQSLADSTANKTSAFGVAGFDNAIRAYLYNGQGGVQYGFRRAPGFFDVVCYTGTGANQVVNHNLGVVPELIIIKARTDSTSWNVYASSIGSGKRLFLETTGAVNTSDGYAALSSTTFTTGVSAQVCQSGTNFVAYLFATVAGVSKVGSYTGTGTTKQIDCGFTGGARFVLIKRTDSTGDWYVWDSARGIVAGNDSYLLLNSTAAEVTNTDYVDTYSAGFEISSTAPAAINANGGSFIFFAVA